MLEIDQFYSQNASLSSQHYRTHIPETLDRYGDLRASERGTELANQNLKKIHDQVKRIRNPKKRAAKFMERVHITQTVDKPKKQFKRTVQNPTS